MGSEEVQGFNLKEAYEQAKLNEAIHNSQQAAVHKHQGNPKTNTSTIINKPSYINTKTNTTNLNRNTTNKPEFRREPGKCYKYGDKYFPSH